MSTLLSAGQSKNYINVADHINAMLAYWDKDLICRYANAAYREWFGKTSYELVNKMTMRELLGPLFEKNKQYILGALEGNPQTFEREIIVPGGGKRYTIANYYPDKADGEVLGFYVHVADVTPIKLFEKELNRASHIINRQNEQLLNFANIVSHNLNNYACNLESMLDFFIKADSTEEKEELFALLQSLSKSFNLSLKNIRKIVNIQNQGQLQCEWVNVYDCVEQVIRLLEHQVKRDHIILVNRITTDSRIWANCAYVESIIMNFLTNAIKYRHPDRVAIIELIPIMYREQFALKIRDNGMGIDLNKHGQRLFGMYNTFHGNADAEGIGLYITKFQVESMGGHIEVESEVNQGATFTAFFPTTVSQAIFDMVPNVKVGL